jgi:hypothetical protein
VLGSIVGCIGGHDIFEAMKTLLLDDDIGFPPEIWALFLLIILLLLGLYSWSVIKLFDSASAVRKKGLMGFCALFLLLVMWALLVRVSIHGRWAASTREVVRRAISFVE